MNTEKLLKPDYLFEVSWEVCNKVGGIHTVISTKAFGLVKSFENNYICIGPDVWKGTETNPEFTEDKFLFRSWRDYASEQGLKFKIGRWNIPGKPIAILVDFTPYFSKKDDIFTDFFLKFNLDSLSGQWDYTEPALFGYMAGKLIENFCTYHLSSRENVIAHFHEWMTGTGILYLKDNFPHAGTLFTTHATVVGRSMSGTGMNVNRDIYTVNPEVCAKDCNVTSKHSLEKLSATQADCFTTVSDITSDEGEFILSKKPDIITPNGFGAGLVPTAEVFLKKREIARQKLIQLASILFNKSFEEDTFLIATSGRYEFKNKGLDIFIESLNKINAKYKGAKNILGFILVPAHQTGVRREITDSIISNTQIVSFENNYVTHYLPDIDQDAIVKAISKSSLNIHHDDKIKIIFVPCYLSPKDGLFNMDYYDLLPGFDLSIFASFYEPWGYTPLESIAFKVPTITTSLSGFGSWVKKHFPGHNSSVIILDRHNQSDENLIKELALEIEKQLNFSSEQIKKIHENAFKIFKAARWDNLISFYYSAFHLSLTKKNERNISNLSFKPFQENYSSKKNLSPTLHNKPNWKRVLIESEVPKELEPLKILAKNICWTWDIETQELFKSINPELWEICFYNPLALLESSSFKELKLLVKNTVFMDKMDTVYQKFLKYIKNSRNNNHTDVAYFCMEYGLHSSMRLYSGGLGILAGDYLKEASDSNFNLIAIGLLYRYGYFKQSIGINGDQHEHYDPQKFSHLPILPLRDSDGNRIKISIALPGRTLYAKAWKVEVGRINLYLLDADIDLNSDEDRFISHQLYGGDSENRLKQEILLGIGGIRLLDTLGIKPAIYHCNEGHSAFIALERLRKLVLEENLTFNEALEIVRSSTLFTTHTPVPAGHDLFTEDLLRTYCSNYADLLNIHWNELMAMGKMDENSRNEKFSMSYFSARASQEINAVSKVHGAVSRKMFNPLWEGYSIDELHVGHVTNGVHYYTWTAEPFQKLFRESFGKSFESDQSNKTHWTKIHSVKDEEIWEIRKSLKKVFISKVINKLKHDLTLRYENPQKILQTINSINEDALCIGFSRRFATYKRADLILTQPERLAKIIGNTERPVLFFYSGKAHPADKAGQDVIKKIINTSHNSQLQGKILFLENYDMEIATYLVQGVDLWLNNPIRPLEASGTSGMKACMNGVLNFSVLDGWWPEAYSDKAGWALPLEQTYDDPVLQNELDAELIYSTLENEIIPEYFERDKSDIPRKWLKRIKNTLADIVPDFTTKRMIDDYNKKYYTKLIKRSKWIKANQFEYAKKIASWKKKILLGWDSIEVLSIKSYDLQNKPLPMGKNFEAEILLDLKELPVNDIGVEIVFAEKKDAHSATEISFTEKLKNINTEGSKTLFRCSVPMSRSGVFDYGFRIYPTNELLAHRQDFNLIKWI